jgi:hypothetical protein
MGWYPCKLQELESLGWLPVRNVRANGNESKSRRLSETTVSKMVVLNLDQPIERTMTKTSKLPRGRIVQSPNMEPKFIPWLCAFDIPAEMSMGRM